MASLPESISETARGLSQGLSEAALQGTSGFVGVFCEGLTWGSPASPPRGRARRTLARCEFLPPTKVFGPAPPGSRDLRAAGTPSLQRGEGGVPSVCQGRAGVKEGR